jgi:hypothetical protein
VNTYVDKKNDRIYAPRVMMILYPLDINCLHTYLKWHVTLVVKPYNCVTYVCANTWCCVIRVARWYIFRPKIPIWLNSERSCIGRFCYILWTLGLFYGHWIYFMAIWYILWPFGIFCVNVVLFYPFWYVEPIRIWQPCMSIMLCWWILVIYVLNQSPLMSSSCFFEAQLL